MKLLKIDTLINVAVESKTDLNVLITKLIDHNITHFVITEDKVTIGARDTSFNVITKSTLTNGYIVTIHCKTTDILNVLKELI